MKCHIREIGKKKFVKGVDSCYRILGLTENPNEADVYRKSTGRHISDMINILDYVDENENVSNFRTTKSIFY
ncbi:MAG TPA: hypothetical protein P5277_01795 [Candidatus Paceibacterota bacterium]|nr:hypothetical protein [Candidatus Paceibacterota bacterium]